MGRPRKKKLEQDPNSEDSGIFPRAQNAQDDVMQKPDETGSVDLLTNEMDPTLWDLSSMQQLSSDGPAASTINFDFSQDFSADPIFSLPNPITTTNFERQPTPAFTDVPLVVTPPPTSGNFFLSAFPGDRISGCRCLPKLYLMLSGFQSSPPPRFPFTMSNLKRACKLASEVVKCKYCERDFNRALQNSMLLGTLVNLVISEYRKLLNHVDERAIDAEKVTLRMGENLPGTEHLHTGAPDCPMGIEIDLDGPEWRIIARKAIRKELTGPSETQSLLSVIHEMRERQVRWHSKGLAESAQQASPNGLCQAPAESQPCICTQIVFIDRLLGLFHDLGI